jgi:hypothetical protein
VKALALHFPREGNGRFLRAAVWVALASLDGTPPHLRGRWLTVRAKAEDLYVGVKDLIGANQAYRWNSTPWTWDRRRCQALAERALAARQHRLGAALAGGPLLSRAANRVRCTLSRPYAKSALDHYSQQTRKMRTSPGGRQSQYCAMARPRMISLDRRQARNRHLAAQPDQTTFGADHGRCLRSTTAPRTRNRDAATARAQSSDSLVLSIVNEGWE